MKHKPTYQPGLTREQIDAYRSGSAKNRRAVEGSLQGSFEQDALDGWEESGLSTASMNRLDRRFRMRQTGTYIIGVAVAVVVLIAGGIAFFNTGNPSSKATDGQVELSVEQSDAVILAAIDTLEELPETEQIHVTTIKNTQQEIKAQPETTPMTTVSELPAMVLEPLKIEPEIQPEKVSMQKNAKEIYQHDLKVIDYSQYRSRPTIETERIVLTGTPADQEDRDQGQTQTETTITTVSIPYMDYLDKTMDYVGHGKWKQSLQRLQEILVDYPDDVNAHFYAGLCSYNLQQYEDAKQHFATCLQLQFNNFNEEATWYLAQSLLANGEKSSAKELLTAIRDQKGYYAKQAAQLLKGIR